MEPQDEQVKSTPPPPKAPYTRPELKRVGALRDVTAAVASPDLDT
jgi:hypothetical protein